MRDLGIQVITGAVLGDVALRDGFVTSAELRDQVRGRAGAGGRVRGRERRRGADLAGRAALLGAVAADLRQPAGHRGEPRRGAQAGGRGDRRGVRRPRRGVRAAAARRARVLLPRARHRGAERHAHRRAARPGRRGSRAMFEGRDQADARARAAQVRVPQGVRRGAGAGLRVPRAAADAVDPRRAPAHRGRGARRDASSTTRWRAPRGRWNCTTGRDGYVWEMFPADHVHYVPLRSHAAAGRARTWSPRGGASTATPPRCPACG